MTLLMRDNENKELGRMEARVSQIRGLDREDVASASIFLKSPKAFIFKVLDLIDENPELDDEEIAEILINE